MRHSAWFGLFLCSAVICGRVDAARAQVPVEFGGDIHRLQELVDGQYGKGQINVTTDYIGAKGEDADPWYWSNRQIGVLSIKLLERRSQHDVLGWYLENGAQPILPEGAGVLFGEDGRAGDEATVRFRRVGTPLGFYLDSGRSEDRVGDEDADPPGGDHQRRKCFYTNRRLNVAGRGGGATEPPFGGDVQALVFDVSRWAGRDTWLVCFEDQDSAADSDFSDVVFEVSAGGLTPVHTISFGSLKLRYR